MSARETSCTSQGLVPLSSLAPDRPATVVSVDGSSQISRRLLDLGFVPDTEIRLVRRAPLGDPIEFELRGCLFCLRRSEADQIWVRPRETSGTP